MKVIKSNDGYMGMRVGELKQHIVWLQDLAFRFSVKGNDKAASKLVEWRLLAETLLEQKERVCTILNRQL